MSDRYVLTCAHVVADSESDRPGREIRVEFVGAPGLGTGVGRVRDGWWVPERADRCGDLALLELDQPMPAAVPAELRRMSLRNRDVRVQGYPDGRSDIGEWVEAHVVASGGPRDEWMQMRPRTALGGMVRPGFSGAGVVDELTGAVVGIMVAARAGSDHHTSWMMPVETIVRYLPDVRPWVVGACPTDAVFVASAEKRITEVTGPARADDAGNGVASAVGTLVRALTEPGPGAVWNVVGPAEDRLAALGILVLLADPTSRRLAPDIGETVPTNLVLPAGRIDLAVDAGGTSTTEVAARIVERRGPPVADTEVIGRAVTEGAALTIVVDSVDAATDPDSLHRDLLRPIAAAVAGRGGRLIVGSRRPALPEQGASVLTVGVGRMPSAMARLDQLAEVLAEIDALAQRSREQHTAHGVPRFRFGPIVKPTAATLCLQVAILRTSAAGRAGDPRLPGLLAVDEHAAATALREAKHAFDELDDMLATWDQLCGTISAYQDIARADALLRARYEAAHRLLHTMPCDLAAARIAVDAFLRAVRRHLGIEDGDIS